MKKIIPILLILISMQSFAQVDLGISGIPFDKKLHYGFGIVIASSSYAILKYNTESNTISVIGSVLMTALIGGAKELVWDKWLDKGTPEWKDFWATMVGCGTFIIPVSIVITFEFKKGKLKLKRWS
jgi:hypothetical protein